MSIALLPTLFAAVLFGPLAAGLVNAASMLGDPELFARSDPDRAPRLKLASYASSRFITGAAAGLVAQRLRRRHVIAVRRAAGRDARCGVRRRSPRHALRRGHRADPRSQHQGPLADPRPAAADLGAALCATVAVLALAYTEVSPWTAPLFFIPALAAQRLFGMYQQQRQLAAGPEESQHVVRRGPRRDAREERPVHSRTLEGCRDLLTRHRASAWVSQPMFRSAPTSAGWCTTSGRSVFRQACC